MKKEIERQKKIDAIIDKFVLMIEDSWTFQKMTQKEKLNCRYMIAARITQNALKGTDRQKWAILQAVYDAYLNGLGYDGANWREEEDAPSF